MDKTKARFLKLRSVKYCVLDGYLYWKDTGGKMLKCLLENEAEEAIK